MGSTTGLSTQLSTPFVVMCVPCAAAYQEEIEQFKKERQYYANAKAVLYPKERLQTALRRIMTGEKVGEYGEFSCQVQAGQYIREARRRGG